MATRKIETEIALGGEKAFNDALKDCNSNLKTLRSDMSLVSAEFEGSEASVEALTAKQKILTDTAAQQQEVVNALSARLKDLEAKGEGASAAADKLHQQLNSATAQMLKTQSAAKQNAEALSAAEKAASRYTPVTQRMATGLDKAKTAVKSFAERVQDGAHHLPVLGEALDVASGAASAFTAAGKGAASAVSAMGKGVGTLATASAAAAAAVTALGAVALKSVAGFAKEAADSAKAAAEAAEATGAPLSDSQQQWLAYSQTLDGLDASLANAKSALGGVLLPMLQELSTDGAALLNDFSSAMDAASGDTARQGEIMAEYVVKAATQLKQRLPEYAEAGRALLSGLSDGFAEAGPELLEMGVEVLTELLDGIIEFAPQLGSAAITLVQELANGLADSGPQLLTSAVDLVVQLVTGLAQAAPDLVPAAVNLVVTLVTALIQAAPELLMAGLELVLGVISGINNALGDLINATDGIIATIKETFKGKAQDFLNIGLDIVKGIGQGIKNATSWLLGLISGWVGDVTSWMKQQLGIHSPSTVMEHEVGYWMARGVGTGFTKEMANVNKQIAASVNTSFDLSRYTPSGSGSYRGRYYTVAGSGGNVINLYFSAKTITQADIELVIDTVNRRLGEAI